MYFQFRQSISALSYSYPGQISLQGTNALTLSAVCRFKSINILIIRMFKTEFENIKSESAIYMLNIGY